ncbi:MAG: hypothetical protein WDO19_14955 [Bacteroidota bacterium]
MIFFRKPVFWIGTGAGILLDLAGLTFLGNLLLFIMLMMILNKYVLDGVIHRFPEPCFTLDYESL